MATYRFRLSSLFCIITVAASLLAIYAWWQGRVNRALQQEVDITLDNASIDEVVDLLSERFGLTVMISSKALPDSSKSDNFYTCRFHNKRLGAALQKTLAQHGLDYLVDDDVVLILTQEERNDLVSSDEGR